MNYAHVMDVKLEIRHLRLLAAVAQTGSVTEAGKRLHLTQSALSHQLRDAEEKLGAALFLRLGKRMVLTPAGEKLLVSAEKVLEEFHTRYPKVEVSIDAEYTHRPIQALLDGKLDVAILNCTPPPRNSSLR